eukprot:CAMPEP_0116012054 /NCGR_PEP_ID=MMETSP0321-20121206/4910_1 /TAXON_ID=163516 /ORGANISM="Leptocylindrus danicus var. danicus, Strain B650" /LENGTH=278 /DNA_ID=CAMNT_0003481355 /DNA_START=51 /DNA_END=887 /DNA_ORIENTATION=+
MSIRSTNTLRMEKRGAILLVALSRTNKHNAVNDELYTDLANMLDESAKDDSITAVVLTGSGKYFSSGADLTDAKSSFLPDEDGNSRDTLNKPAGQFMMAMFRFPKVLVAAVNGPAVGIAVTLLLHCDLVYCTPRVTLWAPFTRLALVPEFCSSVTFVERMGLPKANEMLLLGQKIDAATIERYNLCSAIINDSEDHHRGDPFHPQSIASIVCNKIEKNLLSLPLASETAGIFISLMRRRRQKYLEGVCKEELVKLDERFDRGDCLEAALKLNFGKSKL